MVILFLYYRQQCQDYDFLSPCQYLFSIVCTCKYVCVISFPVGEKWYIVVLIYSALLNITEHLFMCLICHLCFVG